MVRPSRRDDRLSHSLRRSPLRRPGRAAAARRQSPRGPGFEESPVSSPLDGRYPGAPRTIQPGSWAEADLGGAAPAGGVTVTAWIWPTTPGRGRQGLLCARGGAESVWSLVLNEAGAVELGIAGKTVVSSGRPLDAREWYFVAASLDGAARRARLTVWRQRFTTKAPKRFDGDGAWDDATDPAGTTLLFATGRIDATPDGPAPRMVFNGKMAAPRLLRPRPGRTRNPGGPRRRHA